MRVVLLSFCERNGTFVDLPDGARELAVPVMPEISLADYWPPPEPEYLSTRVDGVMKTKRNPAYAPAEPVPVNIKIQRWRIERLREPWLYGVRFCAVSPERWQVEMFREQMSWCLPR